MNLTRVQEAGLTPSKVVGNMDYYDATALVRLDKAQSMSTKWDAKFAKRTVTVSGEHPTMIDLEGLPEAFTNGRLVLNEQPVQMAA